MCCLPARLQNSPYFCVFKYARAVKQKVWNEAENREQSEARALRARKTLTPRFTDFFTDFEKKLSVLQSTCPQGYLFSEFRISRWILQLLFKIGFRVGFFTGGAQTICLCSRLLFYSKCTGFTVCLTYSYISLIMYIIPGLLKTWLAKISTHSTTWQFKTIKLIQRPIKSLYYMAESVFAMRLVNLRSVTCYTDQHF